MTQTAKRKYLLAALRKEQPRYSKLEIPSDEQEQKILLRSLFNIRMPKPVSHAFLEVQNAYLQEETIQKGITSLADLQPIKQGMYLWRGDITTLACDAIVNAANSQMLGCFCPNHGCVDNAIHTFAGVQLRLACAELMNKQKHAKMPAGQKLRLPLICLVNMCSIRSARSFVTGLQQKIKGCLLPATVPA